MQFKKVNIAIALISFLFTLGILEIFLRIFAPQPVDYFYFETSPKPGSTIYRWNIPITFNQEGFRDVDHIVLKKETTTRIAVLGDSITYGTGVRFEDTYHQKLQALLRDRSPEKNIEVLTFNQGATNTEWALKQYQYSARKYHPDIVLLGFCLNDFENYEKPQRLTEISVRELLMDILAEIHQRARVYSHLYFLVFERSRTFFYQHFIDRRTRTMDSWIPMLADAPEYKELFAEEVQSTARKLAEFKKTVEADGAQFYVIIFPFEMQLGPAEANVYAKEYSEPRVMSAPKAIAQQLLESELERLQVSFIDLLPAFRNYQVKHPQSKIYFRELGGMLDWAHPNAYGHKLAAETIASKLGSN